jgi:hypothetical protein
MAPAASWFQPPGVTGLVRLRLLQRQGSPQRIIFHLILAVSGFGPWGLASHRDLEETTIYLHLSQKHLGETASPLDALSLSPAPANHRPHSKK